MLSVDPLSVETGLSTVVGVFIFMMRLPLSGGGKATIFLGAGNGSRSQLCPEIPELSGRGEVPRFRVAIIFNFVC